MLKDMIPVRNIFLLPDHGKETFASPFRISIDAARILAITPVVL